MFENFDSEEHPVLSYEKIVESGEWWEKKEVRGLMESDPHYRDQGVKIEDEAVIIFH